MCDFTPVQRDASTRGFALPRRYLAANLLLLLGIGLLWGGVYAAQQSSPEAAQKQQVAARLAEVFTSLPYTVGQWHAHELHLSQKVVQILQYDWAAARNYTLSQETISLFVFRAQDEKAFLLRAHPPPHCAVAQGWQNVSVSPETVIVAGVPVAAQRMVAEKDGMHRVTFYCEFPGWHLDARGRRTADVYTVQAHADVTTSPDETAEVLRQFLADLQPGTTAQPVGEGPAVRLLALDFVSRSIHPGSTLEVKGRWEGAQGEYVRAQLIGEDRSIWAKQRGQIPPGSGEQPQCVDLTLTIPGETHVGHYYLEFTVQPSAGGEREPFVNPQGMVTTEVLEPVVVKPRIPGPSNLTMQHQLNAALGEEVALLGYDLSWPDPGRALSVTLYWQAKQRMGLDYTVFVHLLGQDGQLVTQHDSQPLESHYPTSFWDVGEIVADTHTLDTTGLPLADYQIEVGMYHLLTMERLPVYVDGLPVAENRVLLPAVVVLPMADFE